MEYGQKVLVYVDDIEKWQVGELIERCISVEDGILEKWRIQVVTGTALVRYMKDTMYEFKKDGCGYLLEEGKEIKAKINFKTWDLEEWSESWDDPEYFKDLFSNKEEIYTLRWDGQEFFEIVNIEDERENELFEPHQLIILEV